MAAQTTETLLLVVDIQANNARLAELTKQLTDTKAANAALNESFKQGKITADELAVGQQQLKAQTAAITQETRVLTAANTAQQKVTEAAAGSIAQLRAQLALNTAAYNKLSKEERDNTDAGQKLQAETKAISDELKRLEGSVGSAVRNVGNYNEGIKDVNVVNGKAIGFFDRLRGSAEGLPGPLKATAGGLAETGSGLLSATKAALAFIATPIGLFLAAITAAFFVLKEAFTSTDEGQEDLAAGTAALGGVLNVLKGIVIDTGKFIVKLFTDPKLAAKELLDFLENQVVNRVKAYGVLFDALRNGDFKQAANGVLQLATGVENVVGKAQALTGEFRRAATAAVEISRAKDKLEDLEIDAVARGEKQRQQAERLVLTAKDRNLTEQQRLKNLDEASRLEKAVLDDNLRIERERLRILQLENVEREKKGVLQDSERREEQEQLAKLAQLQGNYEKEEQARANRRSVLQESEAAERIKAAREAAELRQKAVEDEIKGRITATETELLTVKAGSERELVLREQLIRQKSELEAAGEKKSAADRKLILTQSLAEMLRLDEEFDQKRQENARKFLDNQLSRDQAVLAADKKRREDAAREQEEDFKRAEGLVERQLSRMRTSIEQDYADGRRSKVEYDAFIAQQDQTDYAARIILARQYSRDTTKIEADQAKSRRTAAVKTREEERKLNEERLKSAEALGSQIGQLFADTLNDTGQSLQEFAGKVIVLILDSLEKTVLAATAEAAAKSIGANPTPAGFIQAAITTAAITVAFEAAKSAITASTAQPFNTGGIVGGVLSPGTPNKDTELTYLTKGEMVLSQGVASTFPELPPVLGYLNSLAGGVNFAPGFTPARAPQQDGGLMARTVGQGYFPTAAEIGEAVGRNVPDSIAVDEISRAQGRKARVRSLTSLGQRP